MRERGNEKCNLAFSKKKRSKTLKKNPLILKLARIDHIEETKIKLIKKIILFCVSFLFPCSNSLIFEYVL